MRRLKAVAAIAFGVFLFAAGVNHFIHPEFYASFVPSWISEDFANWSSGILETLLGVGLILPPTRRYAAWGGLGLMVAFLPLHIWDVVREDPAIGSATMAYVRLPIQFLFMGWMWWVAQPDGRQFDRR